MRVAKLLLWMFALILLVGSASAVLDTEKQRAVGGTDTAYFASTTDYSYWQSWTSNDTYNLTNITVWLSKNLNPTQALSSYIMQSNGTIPSVVAIQASSVNLSAASLTTNCLPYNFTFTNLSIVNGTRYYFVMTSPTVDAGGHNPEMCFNGGAGTENRGYGNQARTSFTNQDTTTTMNFITYGELTASDTNFTITAIDEFNSSSLFTFSVYIFNGTNGTWHHTTTGILITDYLNNGTLLYNITINATDYINRTYINYNMSYSGNLNNSALHQAELCLNATAKVSNASLTGVTFYTGSKNTTSCFNVTAATHSVTAVKAGWFNQTQSFTLTALEQENNTLVNMSYANFTIYVRKANGGAFLSSYALNISSLNYTSWPGENQTSVSNYSRYLINNTYSVTVRKSGYSTTNATANITVAGHTNYTFYLYEENTLNVSVYDEQTNTLLNNTNVTIDIIQTNQTGNYTTSNGTLYVSSLAPGEIEIRYADVAGLYRGRVYILTLSNLTYQEVRLYLLNATLGSLITLDLVDQDGQDVEGGVIKAQRFYPAENLYRTVAMTRTNFNGQGSIDMVKKSTLSNIFYKFIVEINGTVKEETDALEINPLTTDVLYFTINVLENIFTSWDGTNTGTVSGNLSFNNNTNQFSFVWNDATNLIREGCLKVRRVTPLTETVICNNCTVSASATLLCIVTNTGNLYRAEGLIDTTTNNSLYTVAVLDYSYDNKSTTFGLFGVFLSVLFIGTFAMIGLWNPIVAVVLATVATIFTAILGMVHMTYVTVVTIVILAGIIIAKSRT